MITLGAAFALVVPGLVNFLALFGIGLLFFPLPTLWLYAGLPAAFYFILRKFGVTITRSLLSAGAAAVAVLAVGWLLASVTNQRTQSTLANLSESDSTVQLQIGATTTFVDLRHYRDLEDRSDLRCDSDCQRVLFSGFARRYAMGTSDGFDPTQTTQTVAIVHEIVPISQGCGETLVSIASAEDRDFTGEVDRRNLGLTDFVVFLEFDHDLCLSSTLIEEVAGDVVLSRSRDQFTNTEVGNVNSDRRPYYDWGFDRIDQVDRVEFFEMTDGKLESRFRWTSVDYDRLGEPLLISLPGFISKFRHGGWSYAEMHTEREYWSLDDLIDYDFSVGNLAPDEINSWHTRP